MLIAEDLLLLLTDPESGRLLVPAQHADIALGGALLVELSVAGRVVVDDRKRLQVAGHGAVTDPVLADALRTVAGKAGRKPKTVMSPLSKGIRATTYRRLAAAGVLREQRTRVLGLFPQTRWPAADAHPRAVLLDALVQVLVTGTTPTATTGALVGLLVAMRATHQVVDPREHRIGRRTLDRRAGQVAEGDWASSAVRSAIDAAQAAMTAAIVASTSVVVTSG